MQGKVLVAGVGNIFCCDDAFGVEVVQELAKRHLPANVEVRDFGIRSYDLAYALMEPWDLVVLVDAVPVGDEPGTVYTIEPELPADGEPPESAAFDAHTMNPVTVMQMVRAMGGKCSPMLLVGCEPAKVDMGTPDQMGMSAPVQNAIETAIQTVERIVASVKAKAA